MNEVFEIIQTLKKHGHQAVLAGGCVRDSLLGIPPKDYDIATNATPDQVENLFNKTITVGKAFGVIIVVIDGTEFEVATFRSDGNYGDGRRPDSIEFVSMEKDAERRDLTINAMFKDPTTNEIYDFVGGKRDLEDGVIRMVGNPEDRINEDKLRMLRVVRFAARFNFKVDSLLTDVVNLHAEEIHTVSKERIGEELTKILQTSHPRKALTLLKEMGLLKRVLPEVADLEGVEQPPEFHPEGDCWEHTILALEFLVKDASDELRWATLLHDVGKPLTFKVVDRIRFNDHDLIGAGLVEEILKRLKFSNDFVAHVVSLVKNHMRFASLQKMRESKVKRFLRMDRFKDHLELHKTDCLASHSNLGNYDFAVFKLAEIPKEELKPERLVNGHDLIEMGLKPGPEFKKILTEVEDLQLEGKITTREEGVDTIRRLYVL